MSTPAVRLRLNTRYSDKSPVQDTPSIEASQALAFVRGILSSQQLGSLQEKIFLSAWNDETYEEIARVSCYHPVYVKAVGSQLWELMSDALGQTVTKRNLKPIITACIQTRADGREPVLVTTLNTDAIRFPGSILAADSNLYINRPPVEEYVLAELHKSGGLVRIKAPQKMGKTSLICHLLATDTQSEMHTVLLNFQQVDHELFNNLNKFLRWFCKNVSRQLNLETNLDEVWDEEIGSKVSCSVFFQQCLLKQLDRPLLLILDNVHRIFEYPELAKDFLPLLRTWHELAMEDPLWRGLRMAIVYSTDVYVPLNISHSPFNVGLPIELPDLTSTQVRELAQRYDLDPTLTAAVLPPLMALVGGQPYLLNLAFYCLSQQQLSVEQLINDAPTQVGIYSDHLRRYEVRLREYPELEAAFKQVVATTQPIPLDTVVAYRLAGLGLVRLEQNGAMSRYELYRRYFCEKWQISLSETPAAKS